MLIKKLLFIIAFSTVIAPFVLAPHYKDVGGKIKSNKSKARNWDQRSKTRTNEISNRITTERDTGRNRGFKTNRETGIIILADDGDSEIVRVHPSFTVNTGAIAVKITEGEVTNLRAKTTEAIFSNTQLKALEADINKVIKDNPGVSKAKLESLVEGTIDSYQLVIDEVGLTK